MKTIRQMAACVLTGILMVNTIVVPTGAAVYEQDGEREVLSWNQTEGAGSGQEEEDVLPGSQYGWDASLDQGPEMDPGEEMDESALEIPGQGQPQEWGQTDQEEIDGEDNRAGLEELQEPGPNPDICDGSDVEAMEQEELDRALAEGRAEFQPNDENDGAMEPRAGIAGGDLVAVASREVGVSGRPNKYTYWLGSISGTYSYAWCHAFVSWCGAQAGAGGQIPRTASCFYGAQEFKAKGQWRNRISGYVPKSGDIIYFDWDANGGYDHVGIVHYVSGGRVHTIEGNAGNAVRADGGRVNGYSLTDSQIIGYGTPDYGMDPDLQACVDSVTGGVSSIQVKGWAFDRSSLSKSLEMRVYVGGPENSGAPVYTIKADKERKDVNAVYPGVGDFHGFDEKISVGLTGKQPVYVYVGPAESGKADQLVGYWTVDITADTKSPVIKKVKVSGVSAEGYTVTCKVSDNVGVDRVLFPSWHDSKTGNEAVWFPGTITDGKASCFIPIDQLGGQSGSYTTHIYAYDGAGNYSAAAADPVAIDVVSLKFYNQQNLSTDFDGLIENESSKKVMTVKEGVIQSGSRTEEQEGQVWVFKKNSDGSYSIQSKAEGKHLSVASADPGAQAVLSEEESGQQWSILGAGEESYYLKAKTSDNCVLAPDPKGGEDPSYCLDPFGATEEQRFKIRKLSTNVKNINLAQEAVELTEIGQKETILASIEPEEAADEKICWKSSDEKIVTVDKKGQVTAIGNGIADITASTEDGSLSVVCKVTVAVKVTSVDLNKQEIKLTGKGTVKKLSVSVTPENAYDRKVTWESSNQKVASVDQKGNVKAMSAGSAEITAQSADGAQKAVCKVTVQIPQVGAGGKVKSGQYTYSADFLRDSSDCKTVIYCQKKGESKTKLVQISGESYLKFIYGGKLYYEKAVNSSKRDLCAVDIKTKAKKTVRSNAIVAGRSGKRLLVMPYSARTNPQACYVLDMANGRMTLISGRCMGGTISGSKVYYLEALYVKTAKGWKAKVHSCKLTGKKDKCVTGKITVGSCEKVTSKYVTYQSGKARYQYRYSGKKKTKL